MVRILGMILVFGAANAASAVPVTDDRLCRTEYLWHTIPYKVCETPKFSTRTIAAPEMDPSSAIAGLTFMLGGLAVLRGRRDEKTKT